MYWIWVTRIFTPPEPWQEKYHPYMRLRRVASAGALAGDNCFYDLDGVYWTWVTRISTPQEPWQERYHISWTLVAIASAGALAGDNCFWDLGLRVWDLGHTRICSLKDLGREKSLITKLLTVLRPCLCANTNLNSQNS